jgi:hypothetical protein
MWIVYRFAVIALISVSVIGIPVQRSNLDWPAAALIGVIVSVFLFVWLRAMRSRGDIDWSKPYSVTEPFWPMRRFPLRYWLVTSCGLLVGGLAGIAKTLVEHSPRAAVPGTFAVLGTCIFASVNLYIESQVRD